MQQVNLNKELKDYFGLYSKEELFNLLKKERPRNEEEFIEILYKDLEFVIACIERSANHRRTDLEDRITSDIINMLEQKAYDVSHDEDQRGHVDITVKKNGFKWIGEAKIHNGYDWLIKGMEQLQRYNTGRIVNTGFLIYLRNRNANRIINEWKEVLRNNSVCHFKNIIEENGIHLRFTSVHEHDGSGLDIKIKHFAVLLYYEP